MRNPLFLSWISFEQKNAKCVFDLWRETHPNSFIDVIKLDSMPDCKVHLLQALLNFSEE